MYILTWKCASCHNRRHFFNISTSKSGPNPSVFNSFDFNMGFAPQPRALFNISTSKSAPNMWCFAHFDFQMCFAPHFFSISTSKNAPGLRCFVHFDFDMCFAPQPRAIFHLSSPQMAPHPPL